MHFGKMYMLPSFSVWSIEMGDREKICFKQVAYISKEFADDDAMFVTRTFKNNTILVQSLDKFCRLRRHS